MNKKRIIGQVRHWVGIGGAVLFATGQLNEVDIANVTEGIAVIVALLWSWFSPEKKDA